MAAVIGLQVLNGCSAAAPRFGSARASFPAGVVLPVRGDSAMSAGGQHEGEVDPAAEERVATGERDFRRERNEALSNLDQSRLMREISKYMSVPYQLGGASGEGLDCSAYTKLVYKQALNKDLPRTSQEQATIGSPVDFDALKFGDLVFFNTTGEPASHVGIYLGDGLFAHASVSLGVTISSLYSTYYKTRYEQARRIIE
jgi:cell wall-associated NlpC family hydrolase